MRVPQAMQLEIDQHWMRQALELAKLARAQQEVPIGAVIIKDNLLIAKGWNQSITQCDPSAHAEMIALREAAQQLGNYRLLDTTLYVTLEPCIMCAGALVHSRIKRLVFAALAPKAGACGSVVNVLQYHQLNHRIVYCGGIMEKESSTLLKEFFKEKR